MSIIVTCACGKRFRAKDKHRGKKAPCPGCGQPLVVEGVDVPDEPVAGQSPQTAQSPPPPAVSPVAPGPIPPPSGPAQPMAPLPPHAPPHVPHAPHAPHAQQAPHAPPDAAQSSWAQAPAQPQQQIASDPEVLSQHVDQHLLLGESLAPWESDALTASAAAHEVRTNIVVVWVLIALNTIVSIFILTGGMKVQPAIKLAVTINVFCFVIPVTLSILAYSKINFGLVLATGITIILFACGILTLIAAICLFITLAAITRVRDKSMFSLKVCGATKRRIKGVFEDTVPGWIGFKQGPIKMQARFFQNAALILIHKKGMALRVERHLAGTVSLAQDGKGRWVLSNFPPDQKVRLKKIRLSDEVAAAWQQWAQAG